MKKRKGFEITGYKECPTCHGTGSKPGALARAVNSPATDEHNYRQRVKDAYCGECGGRGKVAIYGRTTN